MFAFAQALKSACGMEVKDTKITTENVTGGETKQVEATDENLDRTSIVLEHSDPSLFPASPVRSPAPGDGHHRFPLQDALPVSNVDVGGMGGVVHIPSNGKYIGQQFYRHGLRNMEEVGQEKENVQSHFPENTLNNENLFPFTSVMNRKDTTTAQHLPKDASEEFITPQLEKLDDGHNNDDREALGVDTMVTVLGDDNMTMFTCISEDTLKQDLSTVEPMDVDLDISDSKVEVLNATVSVPMPMADNTEWCENSPSALLSSPQLSPLPNEESTPVVESEFQSGDTITSYLNETREIFTESLKDSTEMPNFAVPNTVTEEKNETPDITAVVESSKIFGIVPVTNEEEFATSASNYNFSVSDFDFLEAASGSVCVGDKIRKAPDGGERRGAELPRESVLLTFDPLLQRPRPVDTVRTKSSNSDGKSGGASSSALVPVDNLIELLPDIVAVRTEEEKEASQEEQSSVVVIDSAKDGLIESNNMIAADITAAIVTTPEKDTTIQNMSDGHIDTDSVELQKKRKSNDPINSEEIEKKMQDLGMREETLLKRITEKDKIISKLNGVVEAYERAIAELISEKEEIIQSYETKMVLLRQESDHSAQHLESLEKTFSHAHAKYERAKEIVEESKERQHTMVTKIRKLEDNQTQQQERYEKMKAHAMSQLDIANTKLADMFRSHGQDMMKLKAQLKKEEISLASVNEQLIQKSRENDELVKICDELINGGTN